MAGRTRVSCTAQRRPRHGPLALRRGANSNRKPSLDVWAGATLLRRHRRPKIAQGLPADTHTFRWRVLCVSGETKRWPPCSASALHGSRCALAPAHPCRLICAPPAASSVAGTWTQRRPGLPGSRSNRPRPHHRRPLAVPPSLVVAVPDAPRNGNPCVDVRRAPPDEQLPPLRAATHTASRERTRPPLRARRPWRPLRSVRAPHPIRFIAIPLPPRDRRRAARCFMAVISINTLLQICSTCSTKQR